MPLNEDLAHVLIETLARHKKAISYSDVMEEAPFDRREVASAFNTLVMIGIIEKHANEAEDDGFSYNLNKQLTPYQITKAVELGIDVKALGPALGISERQRQAALALSAQARKLKELDEQQRAKRMADRNKTAEALPRDMIVETLERLASASEISLIDYAKEAGDGDAILKALQDARTQALKALSDYQAELARGRGASFEDF